MKGRLPSALALALALLAILGTAYISTVVFERVPHLEDEFANLWQARVIARGELTLPSPSEPRSFLVPFVIDYQGQRFGKYPPGWPAALSLGARAGAAWLVNPLLAGLAVWLTFRLGSKLLGAWAGLLAALLLASSPMFLMLSASLMSHTFSLVLCLIFTLAWFELFFPGPEGGHVPRRGLLTALAGSSLGLLALTRPWTAVAIAVPFIVDAGLRMLRGGRDERLQLLAIAGLAGLLSACILLWQYALTGDALLNPYTLWWPYDRLGFGPGIGVTEKGHNLYWAFYNSRFSLRAGMHDLFGWPYLSWLFLPFGIFALRRERKAWLLAGIVLALIAFYAAYWIGSWLFGPRYYAEALPALAVLSAAGIAWAGVWCNPPGLAARARRLAVTALVAMLLAANVLWYLPARIGGLHGLYHITRAPSAWIEQQDLGHALLMVQADHWYGYAQLLPLVEPFTESDLLVAWSRGPQVDGELIASLPDRAVYTYDAPRGVLRAGAP